MKIFTLAVLMISTTIVTSIVTSSGSKLLLSNQGPHATLLNVIGTPLESWGSDSLPTGFHRDNYCRVSASDYGNHSVAGIVTKDFLDYSAAQGNDLRGLLKAGDQWCLCSMRWKQAYDAGHAPAIKLESTSADALKNVTLEELKKYQYKENGPK